MTCHNNHQMNFLYRPNSMVKGYIKLKISNRKNNEGLENISRLSP